MNTLEFSGIAQYLSDPLVLVGFSLMLLFGVQKQLLKSGILPKLRQRDAPAVVTLLLKYGFWLGLVTLILGLGLQFARG
jgi:hypothetical protein